MSLKTVKIGSTTKALPALKATGGKKRKRKEERKKVKNDKDIIIASAHLSAIKREKARVTKKKNIVQKSIEQKPT